MGELMGASEENFDLACGGGGDAEEEGWSPRNNKASKERAVMNGQRSAVPFKVQQQWGCEDVDGMGS